MSIISGFVYIYNSSVNSGFAKGFLIIVIGGVLTWCSTLILEAIAEGLQLLEDIKNK